MSRGVRRLGRVSVRWRERWAGRRVGPDLVADWLIWWTAGRSLARAAAGRDAGPA
jgi:hypothetical protein